MFWAAKPWVCALRQTRALVFWAAKPWACGLRQTRALMFWAAKPWACGLRQTRALVFWAAKPWACGLRQTRALVFGGSRTAQHWCSRGRRLSLIPSNSHNNAVQVAWQPSQDRHTTPDDKKHLWQRSLWGGGAHGTAVAYPASSALKAGVHHYR